MEDTNTEDLWAVDLENFPMSVSEIVLFNIRHNGAIPAKKLYKKAVGSNEHQNECFKNFVMDIDFACLETFHTEIKELSFLL